MRLRVCQGSTFFFLAVLLLALCGLCSAAQHINAAASVAEAPGPQLAGNSPPQAFAAPGPHAGEGSGHHAGSSSGSQISGSLESPPGSPSESRSGERQGEHQGGVGCPLLNAPSSLQSPDDNDDNKSANEAGGEDVDVQSWRGRASKDEKSYPARLSVEAILTLDPGVARDMLSSNLSLEEIRLRLRAGSRDAILRGSLRIGNDSYRLVNITVQSSGNESALRAELAGPGGMYNAKAEDEIVGYISMTISAEDLQSARGYAMIDDSRHSGTYAIELERKSGRGYMWGMQNCPRNAIR